MRRPGSTLRWFMLLVAFTNAARCHAQDKSVTVSVVIVGSEAADGKTTGNKIPDASNVAVWLTPLDRTVATPMDVTNQQKPPQLVQRNKTFIPHVLIVPVGAIILFPNKDPFFHNIFSLYDGRRFDLGLYEAGTTRSVLFDRPGISFLFCNIHAEMSAVVLAVATPYFALSDPHGNLVLHNVPDGRYQMNVWYERSSAERLKELTRVVILSDTTRNMAPIHILENPDFTLAHKNKYGLDYIPPPKTEYDHP
jgi:plastocyanin